MNFEEILKEITEKIDGISAVIMGSDGIAVATYDRGNSPCKIEEISIEYNNILKECGRIGSSNNIGDIEELTISTDSYRVLIRPINRDYFMALVADKDTYLGKASLALRLGVKRVKKEL